MTLVTQGIIRDVFFGFDEDRLMLRMDTAGWAKNDLAKADEVRVRFLEPRQTEIRITKLADATPKARLYRNNRVASRAHIDMAIDQILEVAVSFSDLKITHDDLVYFYIEAYSGKQSIERIPYEGTIELTVPSPNFELVMWQV